MPFLTPTEVKDFTEIAQIKSLPDNKVGYAILEAESEVFAHCGHDFSDQTKYPTLPDPVKLAILKLSQFYCLQTFDEATLKAIKSQNIGDYSYSTDGLIKPDTHNLLSNYVESFKGGNTRLRLGAI